MNDQTFLVLLIIAFVVSGVITPMLIEVVSINGGSNKQTLLIALPGSIAMSLSVLSNWSSRKQGIIRWNFLILCGLLDIISQALNLNGLIFSGSAIFTVVYSSVTVYTAIFSRIFLGTKLQGGQWIGIFIVFFGLSLVSVGSKGEGKDVMLGVVMILIGSMVHSLTYIISESLLVQQQDPIAPEMLCSLLGVYTLGVNLIWQLIYTIPRREELIFNEIKAHHGQYHVIIGCYLSLILSQSVHSTCFFHLLGRVGSVETGLLKCVQTAMIFVFSHFAFCSIQPSQCFSLLKAISLCFVLIGIGIYSHFVTKPSHHPSLDESESYQNISEMMKRFDGRTVSSDDTDTETFELLPHLAHLQPKTSYRSI